MASNEIPTYQSQGKLSTEQPAAFASVEPARQFGRNVRELGEFISDLGQRFADLRDHQEYTHASTNLRQRLTEIHTKALDDSFKVQTVSEINTIQKEALEEMGKAKDQTAKRIFSPAVKGRFSDLAQEEIAQRNFTLVNQLRTRQIDLSKATTLGAIDQLTQDSVKDPGNRDLYIGKMKDAVDESVSVGAFNAAEGKNFLETHIQKRDVLQVDHDIIDDPKGAAEQLRLGDKGAYKYLPDNYRLPLLRQAEQRSRDKRVVAEGVTESLRQATTHELTVMAITHTLKPDKLEEAYLNQTISDATFQHLQTKVDGGLGPDGSDPQAYYDAIQKITDKKTKAGEARDFILKLSADKKLSDRDVKKIYGFHIAPSEDGFKSLYEELSNEPSTKDTKDLKTIEARKEADKQFEKNKQNLLSVKNQIDNFSQDPEKRYTLFSDTLDYAEKKNMQPEQLPEAAQQILIENTKRILQPKLKISVVPKGGMAVVDPATGAARWLNEDWSLTASPKDSSNG